MGTRRPRRVALENRDGGVAAPDRSLFERLIVGVKYPVQGVYLADTSTLGRDQSDCVGKTDALRRRRTETGTKSRRHVRFGKARNHHRAQTNSGGVRGRGAAGRAPLFVERTGFDCLKIVP
jgi:hypothetical protein